MKHLVHLETLHVGNNQIYEIKYNDLRYLENLDVFSMEGCYRDQSRKMRINPDAFKENLKIREIQITKCDGLTTIEDDTFRYLSNLRILSLHGNGIYTIEKDAIDFSTLEWIDLSGNQFECTCKIAPWVSQIRRIKQQTRTGKLGALPSVHCAKPANLVGRRIGELTSKDLNCDNENKMSGLEIALTTTGCILAFFAILGISIYCCKRNFYSRNQQNVNSGLNAKSLPQTEQNIYCCFGERKPKSRKGRVKRPSQQHILKKDITVETIPLNATQLPQGWKDVEKSVEQLSDEGIYECLPDDEHIPIGGAISNYPDVKTSIISTTL